MFIIPSLGAGGAERQLCELVKNLDKSRFEVSVVVYYEPGYYDGGEFFLDLQRAPDVTLSCVRKRQGIGWYLPALLRLFSLIKKQKPTLVHGYLGANLPALLLGELIKARVVWGIRSSNMEFKQNRAAQSISFWLESILSSRVDLILANSLAGKKYHAANGYVADKIVVIHNGIDVNYFRSAPGLGARQRAEWGVRAEETLIGIVGRIDPMKDHGTFLRAASMFADKRSDVRFVCIGGGEEEHWNRMRQLGSSLGLDNRLIWTGICRNMPAAYNALDISTITSSYGEGFPNVLGEAMACSIPCVTTDVGDAAFVRGDSNYVAPLKDIKAIVKCWERLVNMKPGERQEVGKACRARVVNNFAHKQLVRKTESELLLLLELPRGNRRVPEGT